MTPNKDKEYLLRVSIDADVQVKVKAKSKKEAMEKIEKKIDNNIPLEGACLSMDYQIY